eukprot:scaffold90669_cov17-Tisochrysis_lutea.AAC.1
MTLVAQHMGGLRASCTGTRRSHMSKNENISRRQRKTLLHINEGKVPPDRFRQGLMPAGRIAPAWPCCFALAGAGDGHRACTLVQAYLRVCMCVCLYRHFLRPKAALCSGSTTGPLSFHKASACTPHASQKFQAKVQSVLVIESTCQRPPTFAARNSLRILKPLSEMMRPIARRRWERITSCCSLISFRSLVLGLFDGECMSCTGKRSPEMKCQG